MEDRKKIACVGFIMDGNRRWATLHNRPSLEGHRAGYEALKSLVKTVHRTGIPHMACYAFSTENWKRPEVEVNYLMDLLGYALRELPEVLAKDGKKINVRVIGVRKELKSNLRAAIEAAESKNHPEPELTVWIALSYGGRAEIVAAVNEAIQKGSEVNEESFERFLWSSEMPDPDVIIRTGGEERLSNFLTWKSVYSELFFTGTLWPDFGEEEFRSILHTYGKRERRNGK